MPSLLHLIATLKQVIYKAKQLICSEAFKETMKSTIQLLLTVVDSSRSIENALKSLFHILEMWISTIYGSKVFGSGKPEESKEEQRVTFTYHLYMIIYKSFVVMGTSIWYRKQQQ